MYSYRVQFNLSLCCIPRPTRAPAAEDEMFRDQFDFEGHARLSSHDVIVTDSAVFHCLCIK